MPPTDPDRVWLACVRIVLDERAVQSLWLADRPARLPPAEVAATSRHLIQLHAGWIAAGFATETVAADAQAARIAAWCDVRVPRGGGEATVVTLVVSARDPIIDATPAGSASDVRSALVALDLAAREMIEGHWLANGREVAEHATIAALLDPPLRRCR